VYKHGVIQVLNMIAAWLALNRYAEGLF